MNACNLAVSVLAAVMLLSMTSDRGIPTRAAALAERRMLCSA